MWTSHAAPLPLARKAPRMEKRWGAAEARPRPRPRGRVVGFSAIHGALVSFSALHSRACCFLVASACPLLPHPRRASVDGAPGAGGVGMRCVPPSDPIRSSREGRVKAPAPNPRCRGPDPPLALQVSPACFLCVARVFPAPAPVLVLAFFSILLTRAPRGRPAPATLRRLGTVVGLRRLTDGGFFFFPTNPVQ